MNFREVLGYVPTAVIVVTGVVDDRPVGVALGSFTSVSLDPPLVSFCVTHTSRTWPLLRRAPRLAVSVLGAEHEELCRRFATQGVDRFAGLATRPAPGGAPVLPGAVAWIDGTVAAVHEAGDHDLVLLAVHDLGVGDRPGDPAEHTDGPLVFHRGHYVGLPPVAAAAGSAA